MATVAAVGEGIRRTPGLSCPFGLRGALSFRPLGRPGSLADGAGEGAEGIAADVAVAAAAPAFGGIVGRL